MTSLFSVTGSGEDDEGGRQVHDQAYLKYIESKLFSDVTLRGIPEIKKVSIAMIKESTIEADGSYSKEKEKEKEKKGKKEICQLVTDGTALQKVLAMDNIDFRRTVSNSVTEIMAVVGIEAARRSIMNETRTVLDFYGLYVNYRHLATLCDVMTTRGMLVSVDRHGMTHKESGPLMKCSFERTVDRAVDGCVFGGQFLSIHPQ